MAERFAYVVMCHTDTDGVVRLVRRIQELSPTSEVVVRTAVDGDVSVDEVRAAGAQVLPGRTRNLWGDWSLNRAWLELLEFARSRTDADRFVLITGQDYPIRDLSDWEQQVRSLGADALLDIHPPLEEEWVYSWRIADLGFGPRIVRRGCAAAWRRVGPLMKKQVLCYQGRNDPRWYVGLRRRRPLPISVVKATPLMTMSAVAVDAVLHSYQTDALVRSAFETVRIPDESYMPSVLCADAGLTVVDCPTTYAYFGPDRWSPDWVDEEHLDRAGQTPCAFIRKLKPETAADIVPLADALAARGGDEATPVRAFSPDEPRLFGGIDLDPRLVPLPERSS